MRGSERTNVFGLLQPSAQGLADVTPSTQLHLGQVQTSLASLTCLHLGKAQASLALLSTYDTVTSLSTSAA